MRISPPTVSIAPENLAPARGFTSSASKSDLLIMQSSVNSLNNGECGFPEIMLIGTLRCCNNFKAIEPTPPEAPVTKTGKSAL